MSTTADEMYRKITTDQDDKLIGLSESGVKQLIEAMGSENPDENFVGNLLEGITILNLENVSAKVSEAGVELLIDTVRKNLKITSFNFSSTRITCLFKNSMVLREMDVQYTILSRILENDSRPITWLNLSYSSIKGVLESVSELLPQLKGHNKIGTLYLENYPAYEQPQTAETRGAGQKESEQLAEELINLLRVVPIKHLNIQGAGIPVNEVIQELVRWPIESLNVNNNLIIPKTFPKTIEQLKQSESLRLIEMSNMKFVDNLKIAEPQVKNKKLQEYYSKTFRTVLAGIETVAMQRMQQSKEGSSSSASSSSLSSSSGSDLSTSSSSSSSSSYSASSTLSASIPFLSQPKELLEYYRKHSVEERTTQEMEVDNSDNRPSMF